MTAVKSVVSCVSESKMLDIANNNAPVVGNKSRVDLKRTNLKSNSMKKCAGRRLKYPSLSEISILANRSYDVTIGGTSKENRNSSIYELSSENDSVDHEEDICIFK